MSNFLTRLVDRTLGVAQTVQPLVRPIFADRIDDRVDNFDNSGTDNVNTNPVINRGPDTLYNSRVPDTEMSNKMELIKTPENVDSENSNSYTNTSTEEISIKETYEGKNKRERGNLQFEEEKINLVSTRNEDVNEVKTNPKLDININKIDNNGIKNKRRGTIKQANVFSDKTSNSDIKEINVIKKQKSIPNKGQIFVNKVTKVKEPNNTHFPLIDYSQKPDVLIKDQNYSNNENFQDYIELKGFNLSKWAPESDKIYYNSAGRNTLEGKETMSLPTIKVNIGRIDVKAVMQQSNQSFRKKEVTRKPKLSLNDYLKQRSGGK